MLYSKWVKINDFIEVSNFGEVKSHGKIIKGEITSGGYCRVHISHKGVQYKFLVHRLVAEAFIPNPDGLPEVNHINCDKYDNRVENLEWCDRMQNLIHSYEHGLKRRGESHGMHKLTEDEVLSIRKEYVKGDREHSLHALAEKYGVSYCTIQAIVKGRLWSHLKEGDNL